MPEGWYRDPSGRYATRWWDGQSWTGWVDGTSHRDPSPPGRRYPPPGRLSQLLAADPASASGRSGTPKWVAVGSVALALAAFFLLIAIAIGATSPFPASVDDDAETVPLLIAASLAVIGLAALVWAFARGFVPRRDPLAPPPPPERRLPTHR